MLRRTPLARTAVLKTNTPLISKKPLVTRAALVAKKGLSRAESTPRPPRRTGPTPQVRELVRARAGSSCERCGMALRTGNIHHRKPRGMGGTTDPAANSPANLMLVCGSGTTGCHGWIESHRQEALTEGWLVPRTADPEGSPVRVWGAGWAQLRADGHYEVLAAHRAD